MMSIKHGAPCQAHSRGSTCPSCCDFRYEEQPVFTKHPACAGHGGRGCPGVHSQGLLAWRGSWNTWVGPRCSPKLKWGREAGRGVLAQICVSEAGEGFCRWEGGARGRAPYAQEQEQEGGARPHGMGSLSTWERREEVGSGVCRSNRTLIS